MATAGQKQKDFEQVRGGFENNPFVENVRRHISDKRALGDELIARMEKVKISSFIPISDRERIDI